MVRSIVGANWGDEGKGKITDVMAENSDIVVRFQGGANAGHTIINDYGKFALHLLPSGVFHSNIVNVIGPGVALDVERFMEELNSLVSRGVPMPKLYISDRAQVLLPYHVAFDKYEEERLGKAGFGSTKSGIAPFYGDKYLKIGVQVCQLYDEDMLRARLSSHPAQPVSQARDRFGGPDRSPEEAGGADSAHGDRHHQLPASGPEGRQDHPAGRPAGHAAGSRSRHLSLYHIFFSAGRFRHRGRGRSSDRLQRHRLRDQGLFQLRGRWPFHYRTVRR